MKTLPATFESVKAVEKLVPTLKVDQIVGKPFILYRAFASIKKDKKGNDSGKGMIQLQGILFSRSEKQPNYGLAIPFRMYAQNYVSQLPAYAQIKTLASTDYPALVMILEEKEAKESPYDFTDDQGVRRAGISYAHFLRIFPVRDPATFSLASDCEFFFNPLSEDSLNNKLSVLEENGKLYRMPILSVDGMGYFNPDGTPVRVPVLPFPLQEHNDDTEIVHFVEEQQETEESPF
jgi:hypothetical protein